MGSDEVGRALARDYTAAELSPQDRAMLDYAVGLTRDPHAVAGTGVEPLRTHGFDDTAIHDICHVTAYYNYVNRMAEGLAVEIEDFWTDDELVMTRADFEARVADRSTQGG